MRDSVTRKLSLLFRFFLLRENPSRLSFLDVDYYTFILERKNNQTAVVCGATHKRHAHSIPARLLDTKGTRQGPPPGPSDSAQIGLQSHDAQ
jgi:hypothetical protein